MGQIFNHSRVDALNGMMSDKITAFVQVLYPHIGQPIELCRACRALEADIICKFQGV